MRVSEGGASAGGRGRTLHVPTWRRAAFGVLLGLWALSGIPVSAAERLQQRPHGERVTLEKNRIRIMDGDTAEIRWTPADHETVRVLGVDTAELFLRPPPNGRLNPRGMEARGFALGAFAASERIELLRASGLDRFRRSLGYFYLDGRNYSVLVIEAGLGKETVTRYGDNGLPQEARQVLEAMARHRRR
jgi:micrococcal nuclease